MEASDMPMTVEEVEAMAGMIGRVVKDAVGREVEGQIQAFERHLWETVIGEMREDTAALKDAVMVLEHDKYPEVQVDPAVIIQTAPTPILVMELLGRGYSVSEYAQVAREWKENGG